MVIILRLLLGEVLILLIYPLYIDLALLIFMENIIKIFIIILLIINKVMIIYIPIGANKFILLVSRYQEKKLIG